MDDILLVENYEYIFTPELEKNLIAEISNILNANNSIIISSTEYDYLKSEKLEHKISHYPISYEIPSLPEISLKKDIYLLILLAMNVVPSSS